MPSPSKTREEEEDDAVYADVGIMFEGAHATTLKHFEFKGPQQQTSKPIHVALKVVDDEPGAVQSGHYLWPASPALCEYLVQQKDSTSAKTIFSKLQPKSILELGAGCALVSLTALQLFEPSLRSVVITDHDPGTLERARDNYETTLEELYERAETEEEQMRIINELNNIPMTFESLEWGKESKQLVKALSNHMKSPPTFDLILGSDLIYCVEVVEPLFVTAAQFLCDENPKATFLLSQSFAYDDASEEEMDRLCDKLQLTRTILQDELDQKGARIQEFKRKQTTES
jgi:predicted nicotinamide N-methyase